MKKWLILIFSLLCVQSASLYANRSCSQNRNPRTIDPRTIIAPWAKSDQGFLKGRRTLAVYFNRYPTFYEFYTDAREHYKLKSIRTDKSSINIAYKSMRRLSRFINLRFTRTNNPKLADIRIYVSCEPDYNTDVGIVGTNAKENQAIVVVNQCSSLVGKHPYILRSHWFLHEIGHAIGLKHPFDNSTGYCLYTTKPFSKRAATTSITLMAYKDDPFKTPPKWFTQLDIRALRMIWGRAKNRY